jgi:predicted AlkP superfamily phosphohydrolase/phosphomutase
LEALPAEWIARVRSAVTLLQRATFFGLGLTPERMYPWGERTGYLGRNAQLRHAQIYKRMGKFFLSHQHIDWSRTRAYSYGNVGQIYLNRIGREPQGSVRDADVSTLAEEIRAGLRQLKNPATGEKALDEVSSKDEIYHGPLLDQAPELMLTPKEGYMAVGTSEFVSKHVITPAFAGSGWHQMDGILMAQGEDLTCGQIKDARLMDLAPTLLYQLGLPVPESLDGVVIRNLFHKEFLENNPVRNGGALYGNGPKSELPEGYDEEIRERLQSLGYI